MSPANYLRQAFPEEGDRIQKARTGDGRLNEICTDFENLSLELQRAGKEPGVMSDGLKADCIMSINALKDEVATWLRVAGIDCQS